VGRRSIRKRLRSIFLVPSFFIFFFSKSEREEGGFFSAFTSDGAVFSFFFKKEREKGAFFLGLDFFGIEDLSDGEEEVIELSSAEVFSALLLKKSFSPLFCF
jgi:hypothetical protein